MKCISSRILITFLLFTIVWTCIAEGDQDPFFGKYWKIQSQLSGKYMDVDDPDPGYFLGVNLRQWSDTPYDNQKFLIFPADSTNYYIIAKYSGACVALQPDDLWNGWNVWMEGLSLTKPKDVERQKWDLIPADGNKYKIRSFYPDYCMEVSDVPLVRGSDIWKTKQSRDKYIPGMNPYMWWRDPECQMGSITKKCHLVDTKADGANIDVWKCHDSDLFKWKLVPAGDIALPSLKITEQSSEKDIPELKNGQVPKEETERRIVGEQIIPYIYVTDNSVDLKTKSRESPYYLLKHEQYWKLDNYAELSGFSKPEWKHVYKTGIEQKEINTFTNTVTDTFSWEVTAQAKAEAGVGAEASTGGGDNGDGDDDGDSGGNDGPGAKAEAKAGVGATVTGTIGGSHITKDVTKSSTMVKFTEIKEETFTYPIDPNNRPLKIALYQKIDSYTLYRIKNGEPIRIKCWDVKSNSLVERTLP
jgi:hypothetical protein